MAQSRLVQAASRAEMVQRPRSVKVTSCTRIQENKTSEIMHALFHLADNEATEGESCPQRVSYKSYASGVYPVCNDPHTQQ